MNVKLKYRLAKYVRIIAKCARAVGDFLSDESFWYCIAAFAILSAVAIALGTGVFLAIREGITLLIGIYGGYKVLGIFCLTLIAIFSIVLIIELIRSLFSWAENTQVPTTKDRNEMLGEANATTKEKILNGQK